MDDEKQSGPNPMSDTAGELFLKLFEEMVVMGVVRFSEDGDIEYHPESYPGQI